VISANSPIFRSFFGPFQDLQFLVVEILFIRRGSQVGDGLAHILDCILLTHFLPQDTYNLYG
jgi:hypothetical protein